MKKIIKTVSILIVFAIVGHIFWLKSLNGNETFPADDFLATASNKTALIIVAHDDDAIGCAGTISQLTKKGWQIHFLTFYGNWRKEDNIIRKAEVNQVAEIQQLKSVSLVDFNIQKSDTVQQPWMPIPYKNFNEFFKIDSLKLLITAAIQQHQPSVIFTLDNVIGGYGHPEHVCVSQSIIDVCKENKSEFSVQKIYQAVFSRTLNENILKNNPAFIAAKKVYNTSGSPIPTVEIDIIESAADKKDCMMAYESQKRNLKKVWPYFDKYPAWIYFRIFPKEYFYVIEV